MVPDELQCVEAEAVDHLAGLRVVVVAKGEMVSHGRDRLHPELGRGGGGGGEFKCFVIIIVNRFVFVVVIVVIVTCKCEC